MHCFIPLINRLQNYSLRLCLKCVLLTGMSDMFIISSVTHTACLYFSKKKKGSLWGTQMGLLMENSPFHITCHLVPDAKIRVWKQTWKEKEHNRDLKSIHTVAKGSCSGQGQTFIRRHCLEPDLCGSQPYRACKSDTTPEVIPFESQLPLTKYVN